MQPDAASLETSVREYFEILDSALETLSNKAEGRIANLPSWCLTARRIVCAFTPDRAGVVVRITPSKEDLTDSIEARTLGSDRELVEFLAPLRPDFGLEQLSRSDFFTQLGDIKIEESGKPLKAAVMFAPGVSAFGSTRRAIEAYTEAAARRAAIDLWNIASTGLGPGASFVEKARGVFDKLHAISRRKAFLERRIHRFINEYRLLILPAFKTCYFEHDLFLLQEKRTADFILARETGMSALLIELESPVHRVLTKTGEWTSQVNHAKAQIADWVRFIQEAPDQNARGEMAFLAGPVQRMVILGRGLEYAEQLRNSRYTDTIIWTYDLLVAEARERWNAILEQQCTLLSLPVERPF